MATTSLYQCPECGAPLLPTKDGMMYCPACKVRYQVTAREVPSAPAPEDDESEGKRKKKKPKKVKRRRSTRGIISLLLVLMILCVCFLIYAFFFQDDGPHSDGSRDILPEWLSTAEAVEQLASKELRPGDVIRVMGVVEQVGGSSVSLDNGVTCLPMLDEEDPASIELAKDILSSVKKGDVVEAMGVVCKADSLTLAGCAGFPAFYEGTALYEDYSKFRAGQNFPDTAHDPAECESYQARLKEGNIPALSAEEVLKSFYKDGTLTSASFRSAVDLYEGKPLTISGLVDHVGPDYFILNGIYCFYTPDPADYQKKEPFLYLKPHDFITVTGLVSHASPDVFRLKYCTMGPIPPDGLYDPMDYRCPLVHPSVSRFS